MEQGIYLQSGDQKLQERIEKMVSEGYYSNGNITLEEIPEEEMECYDWDKEEQEFISQHEGCQFFEVSEIVCGAWSQPIDLLAID